MGSIAWYTWIGAVGKHKLLGSCEEILSLLPVKGRQRSRGASCIFKVNLIKCPSQCLSVKVTVCIVVFLWWDWRIINTFEAFCLLKFFSSVWLLSCWYCSSLCAFPAAHPSHHGSIGQHFFHMNPCRCSSSEITVLLPAWEGDKSQKLSEHCYPWMGKEAVLALEQGTVRLWILGLCVLVFWLL